MDDVVYYAGRVVGAVACVGVCALIGCGALILVLFIAGEIQEKGRKRAAHKKLVLEKGFEHLKAREEIIKRERRMAKERCALWNDDTLPIILPRQRVGSE